MGLRNCAKRHASQEGGNFAAASVPESCEKLVFPPRNYFPIFGLRR
jgi:hypothetical protein